MIIFTDKPKPPTLEDRIDSMLLSMLGTASPRGKHYLASAIFLNMTEYNSKSVDMCILFERIGKEHGIAKKSVATAISRYINNNWHNGNTEDQDAVFGKMLSFMKPTPTVSKFVTAVSLELALSEINSRK